MCVASLRVELKREAGKSLGISIVGGRGMGSRLSNGEVMRGIFIKHIMADSPAGRNGTLKTGDRIVEVHQSILFHTIEISMHLTLTWRNGNCTVITYELLVCFFGMFQVDGVDLSDASHEQAVEAIRRAGNPVVFLVQSIVHRPRVSPLAPCVSLLTC